MIPLWKGVLYLNVSIKNNIWVSVLFDVVPRTFCEHGT